MLNLRPVQPADFPEIAALTNLYIRETAIHFSNAETNAGMIESHWRESRHRYPFLVAEEGGRFLGYAKAGRWRERDAYAWTAETGIYVVSDVQGHGVGRQLYAALVESCVSAGFHLLVAGITLPNEASVRLHKATGFRAVGVFPECGFKLGQWHDVLFMARSLTVGGPPQPLDHGF